MKTLFSGYVYSIAEAHPLQTRASFVLTDFQPNKNKQAIPTTEAENIIRTAVGMPIKMHFDGVAEQGHTRATPIGTITSASVQDDKIIAEAVIWKKEYPEIDDYLREALASGKQIGTSWELYFDEQASEDDNGIQWLKNIIMAGTAIVATPAYGNRTPILSIAEDITALIDVLKEYDNSIIDISTAIAAFKKKKKKNYSMENEELQKKLAELEAKLSDLNTSLDKANAERDQIAKEKAEFEVQTAREKRIAERTKILSEAGVTISTDDEVTMLAEASESVFEFFVKTFAQHVKQPTAQAETKQTSVRIPATMGSASLKADEVASELKKFLENK